MSDDATGPDAEEPTDDTTGTPTETSGEQTEATAETAAGDIHASYSETAAERRLAFECAGRTAVVAQNSEGYAMLRVRETAEGDELERYYGFEMALDHAAELLAVEPHELPVPEAAADMGM